MKPTNFEQHLKDLGEAIRQSGSPDISIIKRLIRVLIRNPTDRPEDEALLPVYHYIRYQLGNGLNPLWLSEEILTGTITVKKAVVNCTNGGIKNGNSHPEASMEDRIDAINRYLIEQHSVCHFANAAAKKNSIGYEGLPAGYPENPQPHRQEIKRALNAFLQTTQQAFILPFADNFDNHTAASRAANATFLDLVIAVTSNALPGRPEEEVAEFIREQLGPKLADPNETLKNPVVPFKVAEKEEEQSDRSFFVFAGNNLYHPEHPRYLPFPALVINYMSDIIKMRDTVAGDQIRMRAFTGLVCPFTKGATLEELRKTTKINRQPDPEENGKEKTSVFHPAIHPAIAATLIKSYEKGLYVFPPFED